MIPMMAAHLKLICCTSQFGCGDLFSMSSMVSFNRADGEQCVPIMLLARACKLCYSSADNQRTILQLFAIDLPLAVVLKQN